MPELAEVEFYRRCWDAGIGKHIESVMLHGKKRVFRGSDPASMQKAFTGAKLLGSERRGKQLLFRFSRGGWLGIHLGMSGRLKIEPPEFMPGKHDHLVLFQKTRALVYADARMFGRVRFDCGRSAPGWWTTLPPEVVSPVFTLKQLSAALARRKRAPIKAVLLDQALFPGIGNWMADEILWQAQVNPSARASELGPAAVRLLWKTTRNVARIALRTIGVNWNEPPNDWLIHQRWKASGVCPRHGTQLKRAPIGGRTTAWCVRCQREPQYFPVRDARG